MLSSSVERPYTSHLSSVCDTGPSTSQALSAQRVTTSRHSSVQCPSGVNLQGFFHAGSGGTLNINPMGNFVLNVHFGSNSSQSSDEFDHIVKDAKFDM